MDATVVRKQILVIDCGLFMKRSEIEELRRDIVEQMKTGLVILPCGVSSKTCDADTVMLNTEVKTNG